MPARNSLKQYVANGYYHIYNRGVEKRIIFLDDQDYAVFSLYLKEYLLPKNERGLYEKLASSDLLPKEREKIHKLLRMNNFAGEITLLAYCLMSNHFHFFVKQNKAESIDRFMQSLATRYTAYFNKKYRRVGSLYQGVYKAVLVEDEPQFLHLSRYIHTQALPLQGLSLQGETLHSLHGLQEGSGRGLSGGMLGEQPSSYQEYLGKVKSGWVHPEEVLSYFNKKNPNLSYESFVKQSDDYGGLILQKVILDEE